MAMAVMMLMMPRCARARDWDTWGLRPELSRRIDHADIGSKAPGSLNLFPFLLLATLRLRIIRCPLRRAECTVDGGRPLLSPVGMRTDTSTGIGGGSGTDSELLLRRRHGRNPRRAHYQRRPVDIQSRRPWQRRAQGPKPQVRAALAPPGRIADLESLLPLPLRRAGPSS
ncbi:hypothetical protein C8Q78DRAFT_315925 [Trametes maxima]|nr:hypothetical protein C8Q78DRAFT_315925 [Trametes maxima]